MDAGKHHRRRAEAGYALLTVTIFVLVIVIAGLAFFAMSSYETEGALYRQESSEAFALADGAVERARAVFLEDRAWRDGWTGEADGRGTYDLTVQDTTYQGIDEVVQLVSTGHVGQAHRRVEVLAEVPPTGFALTLLVMEDANVRGNLCLDASAHVNGDVDFGPNDTFLHCGGSYTTGFVITPPPIYTGPGHYPNATYYDVRATRIGGVPQARIFDRLGVDITTALGDSLVGVTTYSNGSQRFTYNFDSAALIDYYFDDTTGIFRRRQPGDIAVVVMFGNPPLVNPPGANGVCNLTIEHSDRDHPIHQTLINTRFMGVSIPQRLDTDYWQGGLTRIKQATCEPYYGIAVIAHDFDRSGGSLVEMGTETWPALIYITGDVERVDANWNLWGSMIVLGDWHSWGGPNLHYDSGFIANLPDYLQHDWPSGVSGTLKVLRWREIAFNAP